ncbi:tyrosine-type recombinase/integrase [Arthrobacter sp. D1-17]
MRRVAAAPEGRACYATRLSDKIRVQAGLATPTLHGSRHEHASLLIAGGADMSIVSKRLGHSNLATTSDLYAHLVCLRQPIRSRERVRLGAVQEADAHALHTRVGISVRGQRKNRPITGQDPSNRAVFQLVGLTGFEPATP